MQKLHVFCDNSSSYCYYYLQTFIIRERGTEPEKSSRILVYFLNLLMKKELTKKPRRSKALSVLEIMALTVFDDDVTPGKKKFPYINAI